MNTNDFLGSSGFAVVLGVRASTRTPKTTEIPNVPFLVRGDIR